MEPGALRSRQSSFSASANETASAASYRKPGYERIVRRMSGRSPGELRLSAITVSELRFGAANGEFRKESEAALEDLFDLFELEDLPCGAAKDFAEIKTILVSKESRSDPTTC